MATSTTRSVRRIDLYLCRELQRRREYPTPYDLQARCEELYGWMPQYAEEIVRVMWEDLYAPATEAEIEAMRRDK